MIHKNCIKEQVYHIQKTIRLENQINPASSDTIKVMFQYKTSNRKLSFDSALHQLCRLGFPLEGSQIFYWDTQKQMFVFIGCFPSNKSLDVPLEYFPENVIYLRYKRISRKIQSYPQRTQTLKRVKQRTIQQAFQKVTQWQKIYEQIDANGKKIYTLQSAAREVDVAKKTLDDYKVQIRLGQKYNFDFHKNRYQKIGVLRAFNKQMILQNSQNIKPSKPIQNRPKSPEAQPNNVIKKMQTQQIFSQQTSVSNMQIQSNYSQIQPKEKPQQQIDQGYLFHQNHSCDSD